MDHNVADSTCVPLNVLIDRMELLAELPSIRAMPEVMDAVLAFVAALRVMPASEKTNGALVNSHMEAIVTAIERGGRVH